MITNIIRILMARSARPFIFESNPKYNYNLERINAVRNPRIVKLPMR